jgi:hypothetical protein
MSRMGDLAGLDEYSSEEIDPWTAAAERLTRRYQGRNPVGSGVRASNDVPPDVLRSVPYGALGGLAEQLGQGAQAAGAEMSQPEMVASAPTMEQGRDVLESLVGRQHRPEGPMGQVGSEFGRIASMPANWMGPGSALYKAGFNALGAVGGEAGERLAPAGYEGAGRVLGGFTPMATERALPFIERIIPTGSVGAFGAKPPPSKRDLRSGAEIIADNERKYFAEQQAKAQAKAAAEQQAKAQAKATAASTYEDNVRAVTTSRQALVDHANKYGLSDSQVEKLLHDLMDYRPLSTKMFKEFVALRSKPGER